MVDVADAGIKTVDRPENTSNSRFPTAEILLALLSDYYFSREPDAESGWNELVIRAIPHLNDS